MILTAKQGSRVVMIMVAVIVADLELDTAQRIERRTVSTAYLVEAY